MDARLLTRITNVALVAVAGMASAHLLMPTRPGATVVRRVAFIGIVALSGMLAGWRERRIAAEYRGAAVLHPAAWMPAGAAVALLLALVAWWLMHG